MAVHASATFWPAGTIQAGVTGGIGGVIAVIAWLLGIPLLSGVLVLVGGFMFAGAIYLRPRGAKGREGAQVRLAF